MLKKIIGFLVFFWLLSVQVLAITPQELDEQIHHAQDNLQRAELQLRLRAPNLSELWLKEFTNDDGHDAEVEIRRLFPKEYMDYITAKIDLDDLLYTQYLMFVNCTRGDIK